ETEGGADNDVGRVVQPNVDTSRSDDARERVPTGPATEEPRRAECRSRMPRRKGARDRAVQTVAEDDVFVERRAHAPEGGLDDAIGKQRLGGHRGAEPHGEPDVVSARDRGERSAQVP